MASDDPERLRAKRGRLVEEIKSIDAQLGEVPKPSKYDQCSAADIAYLEDSTAVNIMCAAVPPHLVTGDELFEAIRPMLGKSPMSYTDEEIDRVVAVLRGSTAITMPGSSAEAFAAISSFYGDFSELVASKPRLRAELDSFYVIIDYCGQP